MSAIPVRPLRQLVLRMCSSLHLHWDQTDDKEEETRGMILSNVFKVKVIETSMSMYAIHVYRHAQFECHLSFNIGKHALTSVLLDMLVWP